MTVRPRHGPRLLGRIVGPLLVAAATTACATPTTRERIGFDATRLHGDWVVGNHQEDPRAGVVATEWVRRGEAIASWTELFTVVNLTRRGDRPAVSPQGMLESLAHLRRQRCPGATWTTVDADATSLTYEVRSPTCPPLPDQHEIGRILFGRLNVWRMFYTAKVHELPRERRDAWLGVLASARVEVEAYTR